LTLASIESFEAGGFNDRLSGSAGNNMFFGNAGNDTLAGLGGVDTLSGGAGNDSFLFNVTPGNANADRVNDFATGVDQLLFENAVFAGLGAPADWAAGDGRFRSAAGATTAADADDRLVYNTTNGNLYYDPDGVGGAASQLVAALPNLPALSAADISVI
jgi:Ca2+-binding RTX toxin-like protein